VALRLQNREFPHENQRKLRATRVARIARNPKFERYAPPGRLSLEGPLIVRWFAYNSDCTCHHFSKNTLLHVCTPLVCMKILVKEKKIPCCRSGIPFLLSSPRISRFFAFIVLEIRTQHEINKCKESF